MKVVLLALGCALLLLGCGPQTPPPLMPSFPVPPPSFSTSATLKNGLVLRDPSENLGDVFDRIKGALERGGFPEWSIYALSDDGFAVVTRMERIEEDGRPSVPRFTVRRPLYRMRGFSIDDYRQVLFNADPGHYRIMALVVTAHPLSPAQPVPPALKVDAQDLARGLLPSEIRSRPAPRGRCEVLVFEFTRPTDPSHPAELERSQTVSALDHVVRAGLWDARELGP